MIQWLMHKIVVTSYGKKIFESILHGAILHYALVETVVNLCMEKHVCECIMLLGSVFGHNFLFNGFKKSPLT